MYSTTTFIDKTKDTFPRNDHMIGLELSHRANVSRYFSGLERPGYKDTKPLRG
jgi:hypothetical protein